MIKTSVLLLYFSLIIFFGLSILVTKSGFALEHENNVEDSEKLLIKLTTPEKLPKEIKLSKTDASVFFVNATLDSPITIEVNFGDNSAHCATSNLKWQAQQKKIVSSEDSRIITFVVLI
jgi:hypothetical protein